MKKEYRKLAAVAGCFVLLSLALVLSRATPVAAGVREDALAAEARKDYAESAALWRQLAEKGDAEAQFQLGMHYWTGAGMEADQKQAESWLMKAAEQNYARAEEHFGRNPPGSRTGEQWQQSWKEREREKWHLRAAEHGGAEEQLSLALYYLSYDREPDAKKKGYEWAFKAAENGSLNAKCYLVTRCTVVKEMTPEEIGKNEHFTPEQKALAKQYLAIRDQCRKQECVFEAQDYK